MADLYGVINRQQDAARLRDEARILFDRFNDAFWWEEEGTYYLGLDGRKEPIRSVASNAGHLLQSGIVPPERAGRVVEWLLRAGMWSGWGIRTLSSEHVAYNPFSYHTGTVWPHDNAVIAGGFRRYGYAEQAAHVAGGLFDATSRLAGARLPELFAGLPRHEASFPVQYLGANVPQAWAASAILRLVAVMAGIHARTEDGKGRLYVDPALPSWLPDLSFRNLRAGRGAVSLDLVDGELRVGDNTTGFDVVHGPPPRVTGRA
jgi:glycogen debranching enzyme